jgi:START domain
MNSRPALYFVIGRALPAIWICWIFPSFLQGQENWQLKKEKDGIWVYTRPSGHSKFDELKVLCSMEGTISELLAVLLDVKDHVQWVYNTKSAVVVKRISDSELYFYTEINSVWPFQNRDLVVHMLVRPDSLNKTLIVEANSVPSFLPVEKNIVRVPMSKVTWTLSRINDHSIRIEYQIELDPGGSVPAWLINLFMTKGPFESFSKLRERIKLSQYSHVHYSFVKD